ncbi:hypothetical protein L1887_27708 [Cichorium endivia]|nr:hypothetical protein L1887_27708 [Cichorium endivia]
MDLIRSTVLEAFTAWSLASLQKKFVDFKKKKRASTSNGSEHLTSIDYAVLGATSKLAAIVVTYPFQVMRARLQVLCKTDNATVYMLHSARMLLLLENVKNTFFNYTLVAKNYPDL